MVGAGTKKEGGDNDFVEAECRIVNWADRNGPIGLKVLIELEVRIELKVPIELKFLSNLNTQVTFFHPRILHLIMPDYQEAQDVFLSVITSPQAEVTRVTRIRVSNCPGVTESLASNHRICVARTIGAMLFYLIV